MNEQDKQDEIERLYNIACKEGEAKYKKRLQDLASLDRAKYSIDKLKSKIAKLTADLNNMTAAYKERALEFKVDKFKEIISDLTMESIEEGLFDDNTVTNSIDRAKEIDRLAGQLFDE